jgi:hypothetical protein
MAPGIAQCSYVFEIKHISFAHRRGANQVHADRIVLSYERGKYGQSKFELSRQVAKSTTKVMIYDIFLIVIRQTPAVMADRKLM